ncbi:hypothetical protein BDZ90DRAFT_172998 [Jaminaea rosea]|uniref:Uncharacterized protein n=1 Tax=Jaminaea rosea TaxID=1569628 RepID=A0A316UXG6_9BASI|nr:hypothetical protein BDZ90DRAFT_172998 [Jaminaea rosea]PWN27825.1 hypothetical protein BDZ90DRAFT_172998 [Jaminaea rosea]
MEPSSSRLSSPSASPPGSPPADTSPAYLDDLGGEAATQLQLSLLQSGRGSSPRYHSSNDDWQQMSSSANSSSSSRSSSRPPLYPLRRHQQQDMYASRSPSPPGPPQDPDPRDWSYRTNLIDPLTPDDASSSDSDDGSEDSDDYSTTTSQYIAEQEAQLREALDQLELALKVILCPLVGKWLGRRWAYWGEYPPLNGHKERLSSPFPLRRQPLEDTMLTAA